MTMKPGRHRKYRLLYDENALAQLRGLNDNLHSLVRDHLAKLRHDPYLGCGLEKSLSGYYTLRSNRIRLVYKVIESDKLIEIHYIGIRKNIYETVAHK